MRTLTANGKGCRRNRVCVGRAVVAEDVRLYVYNQDLFGSGELLTRYSTTKIRAIGKLKLESPTK